ncbi:hypothetical protein [Nonomuraea rubra]|uniref:hypothetical protein n=1 Tax=Nonomuraea rubra TaxID=46180 RepID=UPI0033D45856
MSATKPRPERIEVNKATSRLDMVLVAGRHGQRGTSAGRDPHDRSDAGDAWNLPQLGGSVGDAALPHASPARMRPPWNTTTIL